MMKALMLGLILLSLPALAQQPPDPEELQLRIAESQYLLNERRSQVVLLTKQIQKLQSEKKALQDYLIACGDKPGCTVPTGDNK